jgi:hypothetical protein
LLFFRSSAWQTRERNDAREDVRALGVSAAVLLLTNVAERIA